MPIAVRFLDADSVHLFKQLKRFKNKSGVSESLNLSGTYFEFLAPVARISVFSRQVLNSLGLRKTPSNVSHYDMNFARYISKIIDIGLLKIWYSAVAV